MRKSAAVGGQPTFAEAMMNGEVAPIRVIPEAAIEQRLPASW
jgi:hypothetical protein